MTCLTVSDIVRSEVPVLVEREKGAESTVSEVKSSPGFGEQVLIGSLPVLPAQQQEELSSAPPTPGPQIEVSGAAGALAVPTEVVQVQEVVDLTEDTPM